MNDNVFVSAFQELEFKKYRKFLIPAVALGLIINANIDRSSKKTARELYPNHNIAGRSCNLDRQSLIDSQKYSEKDLLCELKKYANGWSFLLLEVKSSTLRQYKLKEMKGIIKRINTLEHFFANSVRKQVFPPELFDQYRIGTDWTVQRQFQGKLESRYECLKEKLKFFDCVKKFDRLNTNDLKEYTYNLYDHLEERYKALKSGLKDLELQVKDLELQVKELERNPNASSDQDNDGIDDIEQIDVYKDYIKYYKEMLVFAGKNYGYDKWNLEKVFTKANNIYMSCNQELKEKTDLRQKDSNIYNSTFSCRLSHDGSKYMLVEKQQIIKKIYAF